MKKSKYQVVRQYSEEDCGAACIATIAKHYQRLFTLNHIREAVGTGQLGTTLLGLRRGAEALGFEAESVKGIPEILDRIHEIPLPAIIHWKGKHWVVLYGKYKNKYVIGDPAIDIRYLDKTELIEGWKNWVMLLLKPDSDRFYAQPNDRIKGLGRFVRPILRYNFILLTAFLCSIIIGLFSLVSPFLLQILTDDILVRGDRRLLIILVSVVSLSYFISSILQIIQQNLVANFTQQFELGLVLDFGRQLLRLPLNYYDTRRSGEIVSRLQDLQEINQLVTQLVVSFPSQLCIAVISFLLMLLINGKLTFLTVLVAISMNISTLLFLPTLQQKIRQILALDAENQGLLVETFKGALTVKSTSAAPQLWEELQSRFGRLANLTFRTIQINIINYNFSGFISNLGSIMTIGFASNLVIDKQMSIGQLLAFIGMNRNFLGFISTCTNLVYEITRVRAAAKRFVEVIEATPENQADRNKHYVEIANNADINCSNLTFHYPGRLDLLEDLSVTIPGGKLTALIGKSGCGKSSLAKILAGLYPLKSGNISLGIYNLQDLSLECLRKQVILVPQEAHFLSRSIYDNFIIGSPEITFTDIVEACRLVEADDFINRLPDKYETVLGEFGSNISGGQRQRLALARAIVKNPPILILDESTSGLDPICEAQVLNHLLSSRQGKTTVLISHRPQLIVKADWIVLLENGKLKMEGTVNNLQSQTGEHLYFLTPA
jgi:ATP-binding cassette subfamily C protein